MALLELHGSLQRSDEERDQREYRFPHFIFIAAHLAFT